MVGTFVVTMFFGYGASFIILADQTELTPAGLEENYNGNEENENASMLKFKKSKFEILTTVHSHVFTLGLIFMITGGLVYFTSIRQGFKTFLMVEPLVSLIVSFLSIILMWKGLTNFKYLAYLSGGLMHSTFIVTLLIIFREVIIKKTKSEV